MFFLPYVFSSYTRIRLILRIRLISISANCKYRPDVIDYDRRKARFFDSTPGEFFIFFPRDWHIAKVANDTSDQAIRVIVVKVDYVE